MSNGSSIMADNVQDWIELRRSFPHRRTKCWQVPHPWEIKVNNRHWQVMTVPAGNRNNRAEKEGVTEEEEEGDFEHSPPQTLYLYSVHYDDRLEEEEGVARLRLLVISERFERQEETTLYYRSPL